jgi:hypothetical protein
MKTNAVRLLALLLMTVIISLFFSCKKQTDPIAMPISNSSDVSILKGKWMRLDGGYVIEIRSIDPSGKIDAAYFNPNPIKVAASRLTKEKEALNLFIELRDTGYPGCIYKLSYDSTHDQLKGVYYQAAVQESYDIYFVRLGEGK